MKIDIFQDTICPWCRVGKQHLFRALAEWTGEEQVEVNLRSFLLDPATPPEGRPASSLAQKLGGEERLKAAHAMVCQAGEACGLTFDFQHVKTIPNTILSHQLIKLTPDKDQISMSDVVLKAYFEDGLDIGSLDVLVTLAEANGLNPTVTREQLEQGVGRDAVVADLEFAQAVGISGVPFFIINDKFAISGAQPVEVFLQELDRATSPH